MKKRNITVLGIDGGTFDILLPLAQSGYMPNLLKTIEGGARCQLISTFSFLTAPAWTSFMTGKNPGKHDVFDFVRPYRKEVSVEFNNYRSIKSRTIWGILSEKNYRVCAINVPMTYPAPEVNGVVISGLGAPGLVESAFYPRDLYAGLKEELGPYVLDVPLEKYGPRDVESFLDDLLECTRIRRKYILHLFEREHWDLFMAVLTGTDRIQHKLWDTLIEVLSGGMNGHGNNVKAKILRYFGMVDDLVGDINGRLGEDDVLLMMSDHGFGSMDNELTINRWLAERGYYKPKRGMLFLKNILKTGRGMIMKLLTGLAPSVLEKSNQKRIAATESARKPRIDYIDWSRTRAFSSTRTQQGITINLKGREPHGTVEAGEEYERIREDLIKQLRGLKDPVNGRQMENLVFKREEVYSGPHIENAPDIVYLFDGGRIIATHQYRKSLFTPVNWQTGNGMHRREGIFLVKGKMAARGEGFRDRSIIDVAPTILYLLGVRIPDDLDGSVIEEAFDKNYLASKKISFERTRSLKNEVGDSVYTDEDKKAIENQLRGIGYIE